MNLAQEIKQYYFDNVDLLPRAKRFHFASRIASWEGDKRALTLLAELCRYMYPLENNKELLSKILASAPGNIYAKDLRLRYFNKYPELFGIHNALFRIRHLKQIYGIDIDPKAIIFSKFRKSLKRIFLFSSFVSHFDLKSVRGLVACSPVCSRVSSRDF